MKKKLIISPHCDETCFSLGSYVQKFEKVISVSPFDGIPTDEKGKQKHLKLNEEHKEACNVLGIEIISGNYFDDVYHETRELGGLTGWFESVIKSVGECEIYVPLGIHHPDHVLIRDIFIRNFRIDAFYEECPYYIRYPYLTENLRMLLCANRKLITCEKTPLKEIACRKYVSQTGEQVLNDILVQERLWL